MEIFPGKKLSVGEFFGGSAERDVWFLRTRPARSLLVFSAGERLAGELAANKGPEGSPPHNKEGFPSGIEKPENWSDFPAVGPTGFEPATSSTPTNGSIPRIPPHASAPICVHVSIEEGPLR